MALSNLPFHQWFFKLNPGLVSAIKSSAIRPDRYPPEQDGLERRLNYVFDDKQMNLCDR